MCRDWSAKIVAVVLAAIGFTVFFSAVGEQIRSPNPYLLSVFVRYLAGVLFISAAKMIMWKACATKTVRRKTARKKR